MCLGMARAVPCRISDTPCTWHLHCLLVKKKKQQIKDLLSQLSLVTSHWPILWGRWAEVIPIESRSGSSHEQTSLIGSHKFPMTCTLTFFFLRFIYIFIKRKRATNTGLVYMVPEIETRALHVHVLCSPAAVGVFSCTHALLGFATLDFWSWFKLMTVVSSRCLRFSGN